MKDIAHKESGFTFVEVVVVMGLIGLLMSIATSSLFQGRQRASVDATAEQIMNDVKETQMKAMLGASSSGTLTPGYSIRFETGGYTVFPGNTYISGDTNNTFVPVDASLTLSTTLPSGMVTFTNLSGDIAGYQDGQSSITIHDTETPGSVRVLEMNRHGIFVLGL